MSTPGINILDDAKAYGGEPKQADKSKLFMDTHVAIGILMHVEIYES